MNDRSPPVPAEQAGGMTLRELVSRLLRHRLLVAGIAGAVVAAVMVWTFVVPPRYEGAAVLRVMDERGGQGLLDGLPSVPGLELPGLERDELETEVGVLRSRRIARAVVDSLALTVRLADPVGLRSDVLRVLATGDPDLEASLVLQPGADGWSVEVEEGDVEVEPARAVAPGGRFSVGGYVLELSPALATDPPERVRIEIVPSFEAVRSLGDELDVRRQEAGSKLVDITLVDEDRELAAAVVNAVVREFLAYKREAENLDLRTKADELRAEVREYATRVADAEQRMRDYSERERIVAPEEQASQQVRRAAELLIQRDALEVERSALADLVGLIEERAVGEVGPASYRQLATFPSLIQSGAIQDMLQSLLELENERAELLILKSTRYPDVVTITERIGELETQLHRVATSYLESLELQLASTTSALGRIDAELATLPEREMQYVRLLREREMLTETYLMLQARLAQAEIDEAVETDDVRVVDAAVVSHPDDYVFPKPWVNLLLATFMGLAAGLAVALARDMWDDRVHSWSDARLASAGLPVVGVLPPLPRRLLRGSSRGLPSTNGRGSPEVREAYRALATRLSLAGGGDARVIVVTSPAAGDGKTTVALHLATALAHIGHRTLLVDADLRGGRLHELVGAPRSPGLAQLLSGAAASLEESTHGVEPLGTPGTLRLLASGGVTEPALDLARSTALVEILARARESYDRVVIDTPPVESSADGVALGSRGDMTLLVARPGKTQREALARAAEQLGGVTERVQAIVLNDASPALTPYGG